MPLPADPRRFSGIKDFLDWRRAVERLLVQLDDRIVRQGSGRTGEGLVWFGVLPPPAGLLLADGHVVAVEDYPQLYDRIGTTYNTGGEAAGTFRLPDLGDGAAAGVYVVRT